MPCDDHCTTLCEQVRFDGITYEMQEVFASQKNWLCQPESLAFKGGYMFVLSGHTSTIAQINWRSEILHIIRLPPQYVRRYTLLVIMLHRVQTQPWGLCVAPRMHQPTQFLSFEESKA